MALRHSPAHRFLFVPVAALLVVVTGSSVARAQSTWSATDVAAFQEAERAKTWAWRGVWIPAAAGAALSLVTQPGGKQDVPVWQVATLGSLFGLSATWGVSMGYYRAGHPVYATLSGLGRSALIAGGIAAERKMDCDECDGPPVVGLLAIAGAIAWSVVDYGRINRAIWEDAMASKTIAVLPVVTPSASGATVGFVGAF